MKPANNAPLYACVYAGLAEIARDHGYAMACHGSMARDFDVICIPWVAQASDPDEVIEAIEARYAIRRIGTPDRKEHGRIAYTMSFGFGDVALDLSFMPRTASS